MLTATADIPRSRSPRAIVEKLEGRTLLSWSTVDDFQLVPNVHAAADDIAVGPDGTVYAVGRAHDADAESHLLIREKPPGSDTWTTTSSVSVDSSGHLPDIAVNAAGDLYMSWARPGAGGWVVAKRPSGQTTFTVIDTIPDYSATQDLTVDSAGNVYAVGWRTVVTMPRPNQTKSVNHWTVRKQTGGSGSFQTIDSFTYNDSNARATGVSVVESGPAAGVYVVGHSGTLGLFSNAGSRWLVRRSTDGGASWTTVDNFVLDTANNGSSAANAVVGDETGVYVVGGAGRFTSANKKVFDMYWTVRKSTSGAGAWSSIDSFRYSTSAGRHEAMAICLDASGFAYVAGRAPETPPAGSTSGSLHGLIRSNASGSWQTVDDFHLAPNQRSEATSVVSDPTGNLFAAYGHSVDAAGIHHWIVRSPQPPASAPGTNASAAAQPMIFADLQIFAAEDDTLEQLV